MTTQTEPTAAAKRAAREVLATIDIPLQDAALVIDRETGLPEFSNLAKAVVAEAEDGMDRTGYIYRTARAALKKAGEA